MNIVLDGEFCFSEAPWLSWRDIKYGLERGFLDSDGVIEYAVNGMAAESPMEQYELAGLSGDDFNDVLASVNRLAAIEVRNIGGMEKVWIFLIFLWVYKNRDKYQDPLGVVEDLYADFNYPEFITPIVRYMPVVGSDMEGEDQLFIRWLKILDSSRSELQASRSE